MFALGMLAAYLARSPHEAYVRFSQRVPWTAIAAVALAAAAALTRYWGVRLSVARFPYLDFPVGIMTAAALVASSQVQPNVLTRIFSWRPLVVIGAFSYSVYLIHAPLLQIFWQYVLNPLGLTLELRFALLMTVGLAIVIGAAYAFFLLFEAPFMRAPQRAPEASPAVNPAP
jgi:peptidoglycan/LPS O-acetylase OafA/YrhL